MKPYLYLFVIIIGLFTACKTNTDPSPQSTIDIDPFVTAHETGYSEGIITFNDTTYNLKGKECYGCEGIPRYQLRLSSYYPDSSAEDSKPKLNLYFLNSRPKTDSVYIFRNRPVESNIMHLHIKNSTGLIYVAKSESCNVKMYKNHYAIDFKNIVLSETGWDTLKMSGRILVY